MLSKLKKIPVYIPGVLLLGLVSQIGQVLFMRELLMVFYGSELSIGIILAAWLVWVGLGSRLGAGLIEKVKAPRLVLAFTTLGIAILIPVTILLMRSARMFFNVVPGAYLSLWDITRTSFLLMAPVCTLLGLQFVLLAKIWREADGNQNNTSAAKTYLTEAIGNLVGGLVFTFLMVRTLSALQSAIILVIMIPMATLPLLWKQTGRPTPPRWLLLGVLAAALLLLPFVGDLDEWAYRQQWLHFSPQYRLVETRQSKHGTIAVLWREGQYSFYQSGHLLFSSAGPEADQPGMENIDAVQMAHLAMVQHHDPQHILLIGGSLRGMVEEILKYPILYIDIVELDEVLTDVVLPYIAPTTRDALQNERVEMLHSDGRLFIKGTNRQYDLIIVDVPDPATAVLNRFYTIEFFREVKALLESGGVFVLSVASTPDLRGLAITNRNATLFHSQNYVFSHVRAITDKTMLLVSTNIPGRAGSPPEGEEVSLMLPGEGNDAINKPGLSLDPWVLVERYQMRQVQSELFDPASFFTLLQEPLIRRTGWILNHHGRAADAHRIGPGPIPLTIPDLEQQDQLAVGLPPVNASRFHNYDLKPIGYFYTVMFLEHLTRDGQTVALQALLNVEPWWVLIPLLLPVFLLSGFRLVGYKASRINSLFGKKIIRMALFFNVFVIGFSIMVLQISLIFAFQSIYGFVYEVIGVIYALFMGGLALGTLASNHLLHVIQTRAQTKNQLKVLILMQCLVAILAFFMAVGLPGIMGIQVIPLIFVIFSALLMIAGFLNGTNFPFSSGFLMTITQRADKSAGLVYSGELIGACAGALLASVVMVPIWGMIVASLVAGVANLSALIVLVLCKNHCEIDL